MALYPLLVPPGPWHTFGLDYLTHLPMSNGFHNVLIVVNNLTRMAHFLPCTGSMTAKEDVTLFLQGVYRLHGLPRMLVNDRDPKFVNGFWQTHWRRLETRLNMSSSRQPETNGLTERVNNTFRPILRCLCCYYGSNYTYMLPQVKCTYTTTVRSELCTLPSRLILVSLMRSPLTTYCSSCELQFRFRMMRQSA
jgi:hypothetical protein